MGNWGKFPVPLYQAVYALDSFPKKTLKPLGKKIRKEEREKKCRNTRKNYLKVLIKGVTKGNLKAKHNVRK